MGKVEGKGKGGESKRKKGNMRYESKAKQIRTGIRVVRRRTEQALECSVEFIV